MPKLCTIDDCNEPHLARGWCSMHYYRWRRNGDPRKHRVRQTECAECKRTLPESETHRLCSPCRRRMYTASGRCNNCGRNIDSGLRCNQCLTSRRELAARNTKQLKQEMLAHYGRKCVCCDENNAAFLTLDHINNDGAAHRRNRADTGRYFYARVKKEGFPTNLQVLCFNCNIGKNHNAGICPHAAP